MEEGVHIKDDMKKMMMMSSSSSSSSSAEERKAIENVVFSKETELVMPPEYVKNRKVRLLRRQALTCYQNLYDPQLTDVLVPYVAMNYFDRFISKHQIPRVLHNKQENIKLFLISCLSISWKMRVNKFNFTKFMLNRGLKFGSKGLNKMELYILNALEWRMKQYLIPFCFVPYFLHYLFMSMHHHLLPPPPHFTTLPLLKIIVATQADIKFTQFRPSTLAASAILCALAQLLPDINTRNDFKSVIVSRCAPFNNTIDKELADCMELMERIHKNKLNRLMVAIGSTSERVGTSTSQPIDIVPPGSTSTSVHPGSQTTSPGDERSHCRHGKELLAAFGDIQTEEADGQSSSEEAASSKVELNGPALIDNPLMDFELEWDDDNDKDDHNDGNGHCNLFDALARCWPIPIFEAYENTIDWLQLSWSRVFNLPDRNSSSSPNSRSRQGGRMVSFQAETSSSSNHVSFIK